MSLPTQTSQRCSRRSVVRRLVGTGVLLVIAGVVTNEFLVQGWLVPIVVSSGSMATTLLGPHRVARCPDCGMTFACDAESASEVTVATCPNCGRREIPLGPSIIRGDRILVDRATYGLRSPKRWEIAIFHCPESASDYCVKRVVGLPGETIEIRGGDVYINGKIARKSIAQQREMAVLVHDTEWSGSERELPDRWMSESNSGWQRAGAGWRCPPSVEHAVRAEQNGDTSAGTHSVPYEWLSYTHWRRTTASPRAVEESPIVDEDGYNQTTSRQLNRISDLMLVCDLSAVGDGELALKANDGDASIQVSIVPATGTITLARDDRAVQAVQAAPSILARPTELVLSLIDRQLILTIEGREVLSYAFDPSLEMIGGTSRPFSIGSSGLEVQITRIQVYRDVYYTPAARAGDSQSRPLGPDEYFVLGDNSPISRDSRPWMGGELVRGSSFIGRPLTVFRRHGSAE